MAKQNVAADAPAPVKLSVRQVQPKPNIQVWCPSPTLSYVKATIIAASIKRKGDPPTDNSAKTETSDKKQKTEQNGKEEKPFLRPKDPAPRNPTSAALTTTSAVAAIAEALQIPAPPPKALASIAAYGSDDEDED